jgi:pimeloyl-ACP methyl ester carboxylesterase
MDGSVTSKDGTTIGFRRLGSGPALILLHGAMQSSHSHTELAELLSTDFTCYLPDRRGRGLSGPYGNAHTLQRDIEDLEAVLAESGARDVVGVSSGAIICLMTALENPAIRRAAIFEPPLLADTSWLKRFDQEIAVGDVASALVTGMLGTQLGPAVFSRVPRRLLRAMTSAVMDRGRPSFQQLAPTLHHDGNLVVETRERLAELASLDADVLLMGGDKSPVYLQAGLDELERVLPHRRRVLWHGVGHNVTGNKAERGRPGLVADELRSFLGRSSRM